MEENRLIEEAINTQYREDDVYKDMAAKISRLREEKRRAENIVSGVEVESAKWMHMFLRANYSKNQACQTIQELRKEIGKMKVKQQKPLEG